MGLTKGDYLNWYNDEITRYRNQEWQLVSYSIAFSSAIVLFVKRSETKDLIEPWIASITIASLVFLLIIAELHVHSRLNEYRQRRTLLINNSDDHFAEDVNASFFNGWYDILYFVGFVFFPALFGFAAARIVFVA